MLNRRAILCLLTLSQCLLVTVSSSPAQDAGPKLTLRWFGQSFFQLETSAGKRIVFDPHAIPEFGRPVVKADVVLCSHLHDDHTQLGAVEEPKAARVFYGLEEPKKGRPADWKKESSHRRRFSTAATERFRSPTWRSMSTAATSTA